MPNSTAVLSGHVQNIVVIKSLELVWKKINQNNLNYDGKTMGEIELTMLLLISQLPWQVLCVENSHAQQILCTEGW